MTLPTATELAAAIHVEIANQGGIAAVRWSDMHDLCDANEYVIAATETIGWDYDVADSNDMMVLDAAMAIVERERIAAVPDGCCPLCAQKIVATTEISDTGESYTYSECGGEGDGICNAYAMAQDRGDDTTDTDDVHAAVVMLTVALRESLTVARSTTVAGRPCWTLTADGRTWSVVWQTDPTYNGLGGLTLVCVPTTAEQSMPWSNDRPACQYENIAAWSERLTADPADESTAAVAATALLFRAVSQTRANALVGA